MPTMETWISANELPTDDMFASEFNAFDNVTNDTYSYDYDYDSEDYADMLSRLSERDYLPPPLPVEIKVFLVLAYLIIIFVSLVGNVMVICIICRYHKMRTVTNTFLGSLAVSDLLIAVVTMPMQLSSFVQNEWTAGQVPCKLTHYVQGVTIVVSILTLTAVAFDRFYAICSPLQARHIHTNRRAALMLTSFWLVSLVLVSPQLFIQRVEPLIVLHQGGPPVSFAYICTEFFPDRWMEVAYTLFFYFVLYLGPVVIMSFTYGRIAHALWIRTPIENYISNQEAAKRLEEKQRIVRMLVVIVALFVVCWFPFFTCQVYLLFSTLSAFRNFDLRITLAFLQLIGYSNCCINPVVYCLLSDSFHQHFVKTVCNGLKRLTRRSSRFSRSNDTSKLQPLSTRTSV